MPPWVIAIGIVSIVGFLATHWTEQQKSSAPQSMDTLPESKLEREDQILQQMRPMRVLPNSQPNLTDAPTSNDTSTGVTPPSASSGQPSGSNDATVSDASSTGDSGKSPWTTGGGDTSSSDFGGTWSTTSPSPPTVSTTSK